MHFNTCVMTSCRGRTVCGLLCILLGLLLLLVSATPVDGSPEAPLESPPTTQFGGQQLAFTKNLGQWDKQALFRADTREAIVWITRDGVVYQFVRNLRRDIGLEDELDDAMIHLPDQAPAAPDGLEQFVITAKFVNSNPDPGVATAGEVGYKCNYLLGNDPSNWRVDVPNYRSVTLKDVYEGIDIECFSDAHGRFAYRFTVAPGADESQVQVDYEGAEHITIGESGGVATLTEFGEVAGLLAPPKSSESMSEVTLTSVENTDLVGIQLTQKQQASAMIQPVYSTYLGGGDYEMGWGITNDHQGCAYIAGYTTSTDFPLVNPLQTDFSTANAFVAKLSSDGASLVYSTYLGGAEYDCGYDIVVDSDGNAYVFGETFSSDFPLLNACQTTPGGTFVSKLNSTGSALVFSTYLGGTNFEKCGGIDLDAARNVYVCGYTHSGDFPTVNALQPTPTDIIEAFVSMFNPRGSELVYSTYIGGNGGEFAHDIVVDDAGNAYVAGETYSNDFPVVNAFQTHQGRDDAFVLKLAAGGGSLIYSTYLGGDDYEHALGIAVDANGEAVVTGFTDSDGFPVASAFQTSLQGSRDAFVTRFTADGSAVTYSTYLGDQDRTKEKQLLSRVRGTPV